MSNDPEKLPVARRVGPRVPLTAPARERVQQTPIVTLIAIGAALVGVLVAGLIGLVLLIGTTKPVQKPTPAVVSVQSKTKLTREEFTKSVVGKSPEEVREMYGKPYISSSYLNGKSVYWVYRGLTQDPVADIVDKTATIHFVANVAESTFF